jgi:hypothetical protein
MSGADLRLVRTSMGPYGRCPNTESSEFETKDESMTSNEPAASALFKVDLWSKLLIQSHLAKRRQARTIGLPALLQLVEWYQERLRKNQQRRGSSVEGVRSVKRFSASPGGLIFRELLEGRETRRCDAIRFPMGADIHNPARCSVTIRISPQWLGPADTPTTMNAECIDLGPRPGDRYAAATHFI